MLTDCTRDVFDLFDVEQEPAAPPTKTCGKCGGTKPLFEFYRNRKGKYGRRSACKVCTHAWHRAHYKGDVARHEYMKEHQKRYRRDHPDRVRATRERGKDAKRDRRQAQERPRVYQIDFANGCYYIGKSNNPKRRFYTHLFAARRGTHVKALNGQDWSTATWRVLVECGTDDEADAAEYRLIKEHMDDPNNLNTKTKERWVKPFYVYVIQSEQPRMGKHGPLPGYHYVGMTTSPARRLREHNGLYANGEPGNPNGSKYTSQLRPWVARACYGPYPNRSEALKAEYALKRGKRGAARCKWTPEDSPYCRGEGVLHPWVADPTGWKPSKE
jgi:predicted GIY-YIG superfamily endonuclease